MDDLDDRGKRDGGDALVMYRVISQLAAENEDLAGGLGLYTASRYSNPFIHLDSRAYRARWKQ